MDWQRLDCEVEGIIFLAMMSQNDHTIIQTDDTLRNDREDGDSETREGTKGKQK